MEIAVIGLGKMGLGISKRLMKNGHTVLVMIQVGILKNIKVIK